MPRDPFDALPPSDQEEFVILLKRNLRTALESLKKFSASVQAGRYPEWPGNFELSLFLRQIEAFRLISNRGPSAAPIQLIRDMNHRWPGMHILRTLERVVSSLESYIGRSLLAEAHAEAIKRRGDLKKGELHSLIYKMRKAGPADLGIMASLLPQPFQEMLDLTSKDTLSPQAGAPSNSVDKLRRALAQSAQEYLASRQQAYLVRLQAAGKLRAFIHQLQDRLYTKRLHGFAPEHIKEWDKAVRREKVRKRQQRRRAKKSHRLA